MQIRVHSKPPRFRRAGMEFTREPRVLDTDKLTAEQLAALEAEKMLVVEVVKPEGKASRAGATVVDAEALNAAQADIAAAIPLKKKPKG